MSVNKAILVGRLGREVDLRYTPSGASVANFTIATTDRWTDKSGEKKENTQWTPIVVWGKLAELCRQYLGKGSVVYVEGRLQTREFEDKNGTKKWTTEVVAETVKFLDGKGEQSEAAPAQSPKERAPRDDVGF